MPTIPYLSKSPSIAQHCFIAPDAWVIGDVTVGNHVSIFFGVTIRGDIQPISIGEGSNVQEGALLHTSYEFDPLAVGANVTVGHRAILHGCTIGDACIIGMGSTILDNAKIGKGSIVGANSLVPKGKVFPPRSLIIGSPAKLIRQITDEEFASILDSAARYTTTGATYHEYFSQHTR